METIAEPTSASGRKIQGTFLAQPASAPAQKPIHVPIPSAAMGALPARRPINFRMYIFAVVALFLLGWPLYTLIRESATKGVHAHGDWYAVDLKAMGNFMMPHDGTIDDVPPDYRALDGKRVQLEGYMVPVREAGSHMSEFQFVYNVNKCCFGGPPLPHERVFCTVPSKHSLATFDMYTMARVTGILHVNVHREAGQISSVYTLDVESTQKM